MTNKELKEEYKKMKTEMGIYIIKNNFDNKCFVDFSKNLRGAINSNRFKLEMGLHLSKELQRAWKEAGDSAFTFEVLDNLDYDKEGIKTDYWEDLNTLKKIWIDKLVSESVVEFYK